jgi:hypothetical protein
VENRTLTQNWGRFRGAGHSFSEAEGKSTFPSILKWGEIDQRLRAALWNLVYSFLSSYKRYSDWGEPVASIMRREFISKHGFIDEYRVDSNEQFRKLKNLFSQSDYVEIFDFVTFLVRDPDCPKALVADIASTLDQPYSPYRLLIQTKTIFPAIGEQQTKSLQRDLKTALSSSFSGSKTHIQSALDALGEGDHRTTVRESIHAVESAVRDFTGDPNALLSKAIKSLVGRAGLHWALADAFDKLYAYSNDEKGIRHALVFGENEKVGLDEAVFFLSACTAFVGFLHRKKIANP